MLLYCSAMGERVLADYHSPLPGEPRSTAHSTHASELWPLMQGANVSQVRMEQTRQDRAVHDATRTH